MNSGNPPNVSGFRYGDLEAMGDVNEPVTLNRSQGKQALCESTQASTGKASLCCLSLKVVFLQLVPEGR